MSSIISRKPAKIRPERVVINLALLETLFAGVLGAALYGILETLWRGRTHWTMLIAGGVCFAFMYLVATRGVFPIWQKWIMCAAFITAVEFITGALVNVRLGWEVWDYSALPLNLYGQICARYCVYWLALSVPGVWLCSLIHRTIF